ncbi:MAG TPA: hypothetical protein VFW87_22470 [Pirellulales bacterium]|nr:hypothetical protein [Pirellulales bacterium]
MEAHHRGVDRTTASLAESSTWKYTSYGPSETYHRREVRFANGVVVEKVAELYVD